MWVSLVSSVSILRVFGGFLMFYVARVDEVGTRYAGRELVIRHLRPNKEPVGKQEKKTGLHWVGLRCSAPVFDPFGGVDSVDSLVCGPAFSRNFPKTSGSHAHGGTHHRLSAAVYSHAHRPSIRIFRRWDDISHKLHNTTTKAYNILSILWPLPSNSTPRN